MRGGVRSCSTSVSEAERPLATVGPFARLLGDQWQKLPAAIRWRFGRVLADGERKIFIGQVAYTRLTFCGWLLGQLARLLGAPLPYAASGREPVTVVVTESTAVHGQIWSRIYGRGGKFPQVIQSIKQFTGPTGCQEVVGCGVGMHLKLSVEHRALVFRSGGYFVRLGAYRWQLPDWLTPGQISVIHREERAGQFSFQLRVTHPWAGIIVDQLAFFADRPSAVR